MDIGQIRDRLKELFIEHRIVFWNDPEGEFEDIPEELGIDEIQILRPDTIGQFQAKVHIELDYPDAKILVYSSNPEPEHEDDWLLDIRLYSYQFHADRASMLVDELGLTHRYLREYFYRRKNFFSNKERIAKLKQLISPDDMPKELDLKMIAVLVKSEHSDFLAIIHTLYSALAGSGNLDDIPREWDQIVKLGLEDVFWEFAKEIFGYTDEHLVLRNLLTSLFVTDLAYTIKGDIPASLRHFVLPKTKQSNVAVCLGQWRENRIKSESYDILSNQVAELLNLEEKLFELNADNLTGAVTFFEVEKIIAVYLKDTVLDTADTINAGIIKETAQKRQDMHWANNRIPSTPEVPRSALYAVYNAIIAAADFFAMRNKYKDNVNFTEPAKLYKKYTEELYKFDQLYRLFYENADIADSLGWGILKSLRANIETTYCNWYLDSLSLSWEQCMDSQSWEISNVANQYKFFDIYPAKVAGKHTTRGITTAYVIISDALRYEAAEELTRDLNGKYRFAAKLESVLGVVPSYTALGMAALLPHKELGFTDKAEVLLNNKPCTSFPQRKEILERFKGTAVKADELLTMKRDESREFARDKEIVYIYHDEIDAVGDVARTEENTFKAVRRSIDTLSDIVRYLVNTLSAKYVYVTADHGFVYVHSKPDETDRNKAKENIEAGIKVNKRYLLGNAIPLIADAITDRVSSTAGVSPDKDMSFTVPRGMSRFYFTGGSRFFHGGTSLQEIVVPVIIIEQMRGKAVAQTRERKVSVQVLGTNHRITTNQHRFQLLQTDAVSDRVKSITIKAALYEDNIPITDIQTITFNSSSNNMPERTKWVSVVLQNKDYDKNKQYRFILRDIETNIEVQSIEVKIDRIFTSDF